MATPNEVYNSGAVPHGGIIVDMYRAGVKLGTYKVEACDAQADDKLNERPDIDGGPNGFWIVSGNRKGSITTQLASASTPTLTAGDYFDAAIRVDASGTPVTERFTLYGMSTPVGTGDYRKQSGSVIVDTNA